jgi:hypothetical protein
MSSVPSTVYGCTLIVLLNVWQITAPAEASAQADSVRAPSQAWVNTRLDSLEQVAVTSGAGDRRWQAALGISGFGRRWMLTQRDVTAPPAEVRYPGIVARLARIYGQSDDYTLRDLIIGEMIQQGERAEAVAFLAEVAQAPPDPAPAVQPGVGRVWDDRFPLQFDAIGTLTYMGLEGRAVLERLHAQGTVREQMARAYLDQLARHGFRRQGN